MRVTVGERVAEHHTVVAYADEVAAPRVDADALDRDVALMDELQALEDLLIECEDVPIDMSARLDEGVREACEFIQGDVTVIESADDRAAAGGAAVRASRYRRMTSTE